MCVLRVARYFAASSLRSESIWLVYGAVEDARTRLSSGLVGVLLLAFEAVAAMSPLLPLTFTLEASPRRSKGGVPCDLKVYFI